MAYATVLIIGKELTTVEYDNPVLRAIHAERGLAGKIGKRLGITREAVFMWRRVPPRHAVAVAAMMNLPVHVICPEVFPQPKKRKKADGASTHVEADG